MNGACLDEETVLAFLRGRLVPVARAGVEEHLSSCDSCNEVAIWAAAELAAPARTPGHEGRPFVGQLLPGAFVDRYQVLGPVGRGGMGEVYAAYHPDLDRRVAIKIVLETGADAVERRSRLLREARAIARLSHPNVVAVHDAGTFGDRVYIAMEFVDGGTLDRWLRDAPRSWSDILEVFHAAGRGLAAAHTAGIVHRDFKPQNVMIGRDGSVRVTDFGLARLVFTGRADVGAGEASSLAASALYGRPASAGATAHVTKTGALIGTPAYMAPEQFRGAPANVRSDQFSFCVSLYEALYGERPSFHAHGPKPAEAQPDGGAASKATAGPRPASRVPVWLRKALMRGLSPEPENRWPSLQALLNALAPSPPSTRKRWAMAGGIGLLAVAALLGVRPLVAGGPKVCGGGPEMLAGIWDLPARLAPEPPRHARIGQAFIATGKSYAPAVLATVSSALTRYAQGWADMYRETCEATHLRGDQSAEVLDLRMSCLKERLGGLRALTDVFADATGEVVANAVNATTALGSLDRCADVPALRAVIKPPEDPRTREEVERLRARLAILKANFDSGRLASVLKDEESLERDAERTGYLPLLAEALLMKGRAELEAHVPGSGDKTLFRAFWTADAAKRDDLRAIAADVLVFVEGALQARFDEAERWATVARAILRRIGGDTLTEAWLLNDVGSIYAIQGKYQAAVEVLSKAVAIKTKLLGPKDPDVAISEQNMAFALQRLGRNREALEHMDRGLEVLATALGPDHPRVARGWHNRGEILETMGRFREARAPLETALRIWERELGPANVSLAFALTGLGLVSLDEGDPERARPLLERAFKLRDREEAQPSLRAETAFALARALWGSHVDLKRALHLAGSARADYVKAGLDEHLKEVDQWLATHRRSRAGSHD